MDQPFLLDQVNLAAYKKVAPNIYRDLAPNMSAKRFLVDTDTAYKVFQLAKNHTDLYLEQRKFAKPPFPICYVEVALNHHRTGVLWTEKQCLIVHPPSDSPGHEATKLFGATIGSDAVEVSEDGYFLNPIYPKAASKGIDPERLQQTKELALTLVAMVEVLWLLLHRPGVVRLTGVAAKQKVIKGKLRPMRAHSVLTIDLAQKDVVQVIADNGSRGSGVREHEVRGTWVHLRRDFGCEAHDWQPVERPVWEPKTYDCPLCGTRRVWRKDHVRGEHKRGNIFHTYEVTDSRLTKKGRPRNAGLVSHYPHIPSGAGGIDHPAHP